MFDKNLPLIHHEPNWQEFEYPSFDMGEESALLTWLIDQDAEI